MRELIEGVTKIRWAGKENPDIKYSLWEHKEGTYIGTIDGTLRWKSPEGVDFTYCDKVNIQYDGDFEFVDEDEESPKLKVGDCVKHNKSNMAGVVLDISESEYPIYVGWENGANGCYDQKDLVSVATTTPPQQSITKLKEDVKVMHETTWSGEHYDKYYYLTPEDIVEGKIRLDAYTVAKVWKIGSKDDSGALFHTFKLFPRWGEKNTVEREIVALYKQAKALARVYNVNLGGK